MTAVIIGIRLARAVTAGGRRAGRDRRDSASSRHAPRGAWAAVGAVIAVSTAGASPPSSPWPP
jgi:hypothetical protein